MPERVSVKATLIKQIGGGCGFWKCPFVALLTAPIKQPALVQLPCECRPLMQRSRVEATPRICSLCVQTRSVLAIQPAQTALVADVATKTGLATAATTATFALFEPLLAL